MHFLHAGTSKCGSSRTCGHECAVVSDLICKLHEESCEYQAAALADGTAYQYSLHVTYFVKFCVLTGIEFATPSETAVCLYTALLARTCKASTVRQYLKGLKDYYRAVGFTEFADPATWRRLYKQLKGIERTKNDGVAKKMPISPGMLMAFVSCTDCRQPAGCAAVAMALVAFFGFFRKSNVAVKSGSLWSDGKCLRFGDVVVDTQAYALRVTPPGSKTRQVGPAPTVYIAGQPGHPLDPVAAWRAHVAASGVPVDPATTAFSYVFGGRRVPMRHEDVVHVAKTAASLVGEDPDKAGGHSFRRGAATWSLQQGVSEVMVQRQGDWRSSAYKEYIELTREQALTTTRAMFAGMRPDELSWRHSVMVMAEDPGMHLASAVPPTV